MKSISSKLALNADIETGGEGTELLPMVSSLPKSPEPSENSNLIKFAVNASWLVNWFLLGAKLYCTIVSASKAVTASLADSIVDLVSQAVLATAESYIAKHSPYYPVGRSRLEALSVIACAFIMSMASVEVIQYSGVDLYEGFLGHIPHLHVGRPLYIILGAGTIAKFFLWIYCARISKQYNSDMLNALAEDHLNDVLSNTAAIVTAAIAYNTSAWWLDPVGAILISMLIIARWGDIISEQVRKIVGFTAPPEFIKQVEDLAVSHDTRLTVDVTRVYHFGTRFNVEMEIVLPGSMTVRESHDIALALQHKIESLDEVERAFVHVDYLKRDGLEHKVERELVHNALLAESPKSLQGDTNTSFFGRTSRAGTFDYGSTTNIVTTSTTTNVTAVDHSSNV